MAPGTDESSRDTSSCAVDSAVSCAAMTGWIYTLHVLVGKSDGFLSCVK
jgi:hypothetical protein